jgi:HD-GYP domain-containing protein (c-di-GMP phosphodiesterase class II)
MIETPRGGVVHVTFSEVLSALSHALDLTEGQAPGHTARANAAQLVRPQLVDLVLSWEHDAGWWHMLRGPDVVDRAMEAEPSAHPREVDDAGLDTIAQAFAIVDAKLPYTYRHSRRVADYARCVATIRGGSSEEQTRLFRAGLLCTTRSWTAAGTRTD